MGAPAEVQMFTGWNWHWDKLLLAFQDNSSTAWLLLALTVMLLTLGVQGLFYPLFYHVLRFQAPSSIRLSYLLAALVAVLLFHYLTWGWFVSLYLQNYWMWLAWCVLVVGLLVAAIMAPKKRFA